MIIDAYSTNKNGESKKVIEDFLKISENPVEFYES
jgi:hypothetical protein